MTAKTSNGLVGAHFFRGNTQAITDTDLAEFGTLATGNGQVSLAYVVGHFQEWTGNRNRTGYTVAENSLIARLRTVLNYRGGFATYDISTTGERDIRVRPTQLYIEVATKPSAGGNYADVAQNSFGLMVAA
ncbi:MAG: hypothetical protein AAGD13_21880 [Pseudomonadota bacterium]